MMMIMMMMMMMVSYSRIWSTLSHIVREEGAAGLFKGIGPTLLGKLVVNRYSYFKEFELRDEASCKV